MGVPCVFALAEEQRFHLHRPCDRVEVALLHLLNHLFAPVVARLNGKLVREAEDTVRFTLLHGFKEGLEFAPRPMMLEVGGGDIRLTVRFQRIILVLGKVHKARMARTRFELTEDAVQNELLDLYKLVNHKPSRTFRPCPFVGGRDVYSTAVPEDDVRPSRRKIPVFDFSAQIVRVRDKDLDNLLQNVYGLSTRPGCYDNLCSRIEDALDTDCRRHKHRFAEAARRNNHGVIKAKDDIEQDALEHLQPCHAEIFYCKPVWVTPPVPKPQLIL